MGILQDRDRLLLIVGRGDESVDVAASDERLDNRRRDGHIKTFRILLDDIQPQVSGSLVDAGTHRDVEGVGVDARDEGNRIGIILCHCARDEADGK